MCATKTSMAANICSRLLMRTPTLTSFVRSRTQCSWTAVNTVVQSRPLRCRLLMTPASCLHLPFAVHTRHIKRMEMPKLTPEDVKRRVMYVCHRFEKLNQDELTEDSHFVIDHGLDSLDHLELIMAFEEEFVFEVSVEEGEKLMRPTDFMKFVHDNDQKVHDRELDDDYWKYWSGRETE